MDCRQRKVHHLKFRPTKNRHLVPMVFPTVFTDVLAVFIVSQFLFRACKQIGEGRRWCPAALCSRQHSVQLQVRHCGSPGPHREISGCFRPLTPGNCNRKNSQQAICSGLRTYSVNHIHPAQRCLSTRQMTDTCFQEWSKELDASQASCLPDPD